MSKLCPSVTGNASLIATINSFSAMIRDASICRRCSLRSFSIEGRHAAEVGRVAVALHRVARIAERLKVAQVVRAAEIPRNNVVDLKGAIFCARAA